MFYVTTTSTPRSYGRKMLVWGTNLKMVCLKEDEGRESMRLFMATGIQTQRSSISSRVCLTQRGPAGPRPFIYLPKLLSHLWFEIRSLVEGGWVTSGHGYQNLRLPSCSPWHVGHVSSPRHWVASPAPICAWDKPSFPIIQLKMQILRINRDQW